MFLNIILRTEKSSFISCAMQKFRMIETFSVQIACHRLLCCMSHGQSVLTEVNNNQSPANIHVCGFEMGAQYRRHMYACMHQNQIRDKICWRHYRYNHLPPLDCTLCVIAENYSNDNQTATTTTPPLSGLESIRNAITSQLRCVETDYMKRQPQPLVRQPKRLLCMLWM